MFCVRSAEVRSRIRISGLAVIIFVTLTFSGAFAQQTLTPANSGADSTATDPQVAELRALVQKLQSRVNDLEEKLQSTKPSNPTEAAAAAASNPVSSAPSADGQVAAPSEPSKGDQSFLRGTTVNFMFDGYYGYNFNDPIGRVNLLRAYDVSSNAFSLNQADLVIENAPDVANGKRYGLRLDLQYGQATAALQGNASNEPRPDVYRNIFQAYGTYIVPIGGGLTVDFGKWASSVGAEGTYTKDQINYSRSFWFAFLPAYHMGARLNYKVNDALSVNYWITNGTQQTEPFNGFKDQLFGLNVQPHKNIAWTINYYLGQEHPDFQYVAGAAQPNLPSQQGLPFEPIVNPANGKLHIFDSYATWTVTPRFTLTAEGDYVIQRQFATSAPSHTAGGAWYARYQLSPRMAIAGRTEYMTDRGGLFTGATQAIKEATVTFEQKLAGGFLLREEWRRDASNHPYFLTNTLGILRKEQNTATVGVIWWFGGKEGAW